MTAEPTLVTVARRLSPKQARVRADVLAAARRLVLERGHADLGMEEVAREAGTSRATLYRYFASREHLLAEMTFAWGTSFGAEVGSRLPRRGSRSHRVRVIFDLVLEEATAHRPLLAASISILTSADPGTRQVMAQATELLEGLLGQDEGALVDEVESMILGRLLFAQLAMISAGRLELDEARDQCHRAIERVLATG